VCTRGLQPTLTEWSHIAKTWRLSNREREVAQLLVCGMSRGDAARTLRISVNTLQTHLRRCLWKATADNIIDLIWKVVRLRDELRR
jgi:DNA-binding NarL/FixJ family response regulator